MTNDRQDKFIERYQRSLRDHLVMIKFIKKQFGKQLWLEH